MIKHTIIHNHLSLFISYSLHLDLPCALSYRGLCTQLRTLPGLCTYSCRAYSTTITRDSDLQTQSEFTNPYTSNINKNYQKLNSNIIAMLYLYIPMVHEPWTGWLAFYYLTLSSGGQPFDLTHYNFHFAHFIEPLPYFYPKLWALNLKTITRGIRYPTGPQHNHRDLSRVTRLVKKSLRGGHLATSALFLRLQQILLPFVVPVVRKPLMHQYQFQLLVRVHILPACVLNFPRFWQRPRMPHQAKAGCIL